MTEKIEKIQRKMGLFLVDIIPVEWRRIYFYAECESGFSRIYLCFEEKKTDVIVNSNFFDKRYEANMYP